MPLVLLELASSHGRRNFKDPNPSMPSLLVIFVWGGEQGWAKLVLIALERYSVALKRLTFNLR
jgi:hypothetical protein